MRLPALGETITSRGGADEFAALELRARALHEESDAGDKALELNAAILALDPRHAAATNRRGIALIRRGELEDALAVFRDGVVANSGNQIAARRVKELEREVAKRARALGTFARRPPQEVAEPLLTGPGRSAALRFLAFSIRAIQRLDGTRLAVTEIPSDRRFRVVGGIYSAVTPWDRLLCVSIAKAPGARVIDEVEAAGGYLTDRPGPLSAVPRTVQLGVPLPLVDRFAEQLQAPHVAHLKDSLDYGPPTWQHRHDPALMRYLLEQADTA
jgi:hypothetical protein